MRSKALPGTADDSVPPSKWFELLDALGRGEKLNPEQERYYARLVSEEKLTDKRRKRGAGSMTRTERQNRDRTLRRVQEREAGKQLTAYREAHEAGKGPMPLSLYDDDDQQDV